MTNYRYYALCWLLTPFPARALARTSASDRIIRSPGVNGNAFCLLRLIYPLSYRMTSGFLIQRSITQRDRPYIRFLYVAPNICLQLPSDPASRQTPLLSTIGFRSLRLLRDLRTSSSHPLALLYAQHTPYSIPPGLTHSMHTLCLFLKRILRHQNPPSPVVS